MRKTTWFLVCCWSVSCAAGCNGRLSQEAERLLDAGKLAYQSGDDGGAVRTMDLFLKDNAGSRRAEEAYYYRGLAKYRMRNLGAARADFQEALDRARSDAVKAAAMIALGDLAYDTNDLAVAEKMYADVLKRMEAEKISDKAPADHVYYRLGCTLQRQGRWYEADSHFDRVMYLFAGTELARRSELHVRCTAWTIQAAAFTDKSGADATAAALRSRDFPVETQPALRDGKLVFLVCVGRYATFAQAEPNLPRVRRHYGDAFITTTR